MTQRERQGWFIVAGLFATLLLVFGSGYNTVPVFLPALLRGFPNWSRAQVSLLPSMLALSAGLSVLPVGWLIDRVEARIVMIAGAILAASSFLIASRVHSLTPMMGAYLVLGLGISAGTILPASLVLANWFTARRGLAMGIAMSGSTMGGMVMTLVASHVIQHWGWRAAYVTLAVPMIAIVVPLVFFLVRSRPPGDVKMTVAEGAGVLEGFETGEALRTRSFWMIVIAQFAFAFTAAGAAIHMVAYLEGVGYKASAAAFAMSLIFGFAALGKVVMGFLADRLTARRALALNFAIQAGGLALAFGVARPGMIFAFVPIYGMTVAAPLMLLPLVVAESLGIRRYGVLSGLTGLSQTFGAMVGPIVAGRVFDVTKSYGAAFDLFIAVLIAGAIAAWSCRSYAAEKSRMPRGIAKPIPASA
jgi:sugar phosphate permease